MHIHRSLIAACAALTCTLASAQSSVVIGGVVDLKLGTGSGSVSDLKTLNSTGLAGSRLIFRGSEDLGGGLRAGFWLESGLSPDVGSAGAGTSFFNRISYLSLSNNLAELRMGRDYTPTFIIHALYDPYGASGLATTRTLLDSQEFARGANVRANNSVALSTKAAALGFRAQAMVAAGEGVDNTKYVGARAGYVHPAFSVDASQATFYHATVRDLDAFTLGASVKLGDATVMAIYDTTKTGTGAKSLAYQIGGTYTFGSVELRAAWSHSEKKNAAGANIGTVTMPSVGASYNLSKRTALYATAAKVSNSNGSTQALNGAVTGANKSSSGFDLGVRHSF